jgi:ubiquinone biosynthesis protein
MAKSRKDRIGEVVEVFLKYGFRKGWRGALDPINVCLAFEELGPTFVKIGQILSTRPDIIPLEYATELRKLQDNVRPEGYDVIKEAVEISLHCPIDRVFSEFGAEAIASASMADVHKAKLLGGEDVVVKVQRPDARETILSDIAILRKVCRLYEFFPTRSFIDIEDTLDALEENAKLELDFLNEANNTKRFRENNKDIQFITSPNIYEQYSSSTVLVMEYIEGIKIDDISALDEQGYDRHEIGVKLVDNYLKQILEDGFFHADPHPGNIIVSGNKIAYIDFGLMGNIDKGMMANLNHIIHSMAVYNIDGMTKAVLQICNNSNSVNFERLSMEIDKTYKKYIAIPFDKLSMGDIIKDIFKICVDNNITIPREITLIGKGLITLESLLAKVAPDINVLNTAISYEVNRMLTTKNALHIFSEMLQSIYSFASNGVNISAKLLNLIDSVQSGEITVKMDDLKRDKNIESINSMVNRLVFGIVVAALIIGSAIVVNANAGPKIFGLSAFGIAGYTGAAILGFWLIISILRSNKM